MQSDKKFGECLHKLLVIVNVSSVRLSKVLNVDSSLVNRWINDKRVPPYNSNYVERISEYLSLCIQNNFQKQHIEQLYIEVFGAMESNLNEKELIKEILLHTQGVSIECKNEKQTDQFLKQEQRGEIQEGLKSRVQISNIPPVNQGVIQGLSDRDRVILGNENIISTCISLLETSGENISDQTINISMSNGFHADLVKRVQLKNLLLSAIQKGWSILFLMAIDSNMNRLTEFISFLMPLMSTGKFQLYYYKKYNRIDVDDEFIIIPEVGSIVCLSSLLNQVVESAFYFENRLAVNMLKTKFDWVVTNNTKPLVKYYPSESLLTYSDDLTRMEDFMGNQIMYLQDFDLLTLPMDIYEKILRKEGVNPEEILKLLEVYQTRYHAFISNIDQSTYTNIYDKGCIHKLIKNKRIRLSLDNRRNEIRLETEDVQAILVHMVKLLKTYANFNLIFTMQNFALPNHRINCIAKDRTAVMVETYRYGNDSCEETSEIRLSVEEPLVVRAFMSYFNDMIEQIAPIDKDKNEIIQWIELFILHI